MNNSVPAIAGAIPMTLIRYAMSNAVWVFSNVDIASVPRLQPK